MLRRIFLTCITIMGTSNVCGETTRETLTFRVPPAPNALIGSERIINIQSTDTLADIGHRHALGYRELTLANPHVDPWLPKDNSNVILPTQFLLPVAPRTGIVLNSAEMRLYYYPANEPDTVITFPVSVGRSDWQTPIARTRLTGKTRHPAWYPPKSIREEYAADGRFLPAVIPSGPENPLGEYALNLGLSGYLIHGTNRPYGIGMPVTHGCVRLHPQDIEYLFGEVSKETPVTLVHQPYKVGWHDYVLYLEIHPPLRAPDATINFVEIVRAIINATESAAAAWINWEHVRRLADNPDGLPHPVGGRSRQENRLTQR